MSAARISQPSLASELRKTAAVPWNSAWMLPGIPSLATAASIVFVAPPSEAPGARLNEIVVTGNCPRWLTATGVDLVSMWAKLPSGMICSRLPESWGTGFVVPGSDGVDGAAVVVACAFADGCADPAFPPAGAA